MGPVGAGGRSPTPRVTRSSLGIFHPTFLYEFLFLVVLGAGCSCSSTAAGRLAPGQLFGLYIAGYPVGRIVVEKMRTDEAELILGQRLNVWTSIVVFLLGVWIVWFTGTPGRPRRRRRPSRPTSTVGRRATRVPGCGIARLEWQDGRGWDSIPGRGHRRPRLTLPCPVPALRGRRPRGR